MAYFAYMVPVEDNSSDTPIALPAGLRDLVLKQYHDVPTAGHQNVEKMLANLRRHYYFDGMAQYVHYYCQSCKACQISTRVKSNTAPLKPYYACYPGVEVHLDCTPGPNTRKPTERGNKHILAIVDSFTNYCRLYPIPDPSGEVVACALLLYISVNSMPLKIVTDNGTEFVNEVQWELATLLDLKRTQISPYNSKSNRKVEVAHKTVQQMLRAFIDDHVEEWDNLLPCLEFAMNTTKNKGTGYSPFFLHFGREPILPVDTLLDTGYIPRVTVSELVKQVEREREETFKWVAQYRKEQAEKRKDKWDNRHRNTMKQFSIGDLVRLLNKAKTGDHGEKYNHIYSHQAYWVIDKNEHVYSVQNINDANEILRVNMSHMKKVILRWETDLHSDGSYSETFFEADASEDENKSEKEPEDDPRWECEVEKVVDKRTRNGEVERLHKPA